jgi:hypothetical protein
MAQKGRGRGPRRADDLPPAAAAPPPQDVQTGKQLATEACGFLTIVGGTFMLHTTRDLDLTPLDLDRLTKTERGSSDGGAGAVRSPSQGSAANLRGRRPAAAGLELGSVGSGNLKHVAVDVGAAGGGGGGGGGGEGAAAGGAEREDEPLLGPFRKR